MKEMKQIVCAFFLLSLIAAGSCQAPADTSRLTCIQQGLAAQEVQQRLLQECRDVDTSNVSIEPAMPVFVSLLCTLKRLCYTKLL